MEKIIYKLVSILPNLSKILKELCIGKEISLLFVDYHQSVRLVLENVIVHNNVINDE